jgi:hypothetical protein
MSRHYRSSKISSTTQAKELFVGQNTNSSNPYCCDTISNVAHLLKKPQGVCSMLKIRRRTTQARSHATHATRTHATRTHATYARNAHARDAHRQRARTRRTHATRTHATHTRARGRVSTCELRFRSGWKAKRTPWRWPRCFGLDDAGAPYHGRQMRTWSELGR